MALALQIEEILEKLDPLIFPKNVPTGFLNSKSDFFVKKNSLISKPYKRLGAILSNFDDYLTNSPTNSTKRSINNGGSSLNDIICNISGCGLKFNNVFNYQSHYNSMHRFICLECKKTLPTNHLLDLHLSEKHDSFFAARVARGDFVYICYVEECPERFQDPSKRKKHCIQVHSFPTNYRFDEIPKMKVDRSKITSKNKKPSIKMESESCKDNNGKLKNAELESNLSKNGEAVNMILEPGSCEENLKIEEISMECDENVTQNPFKFKHFSFGHRKERTFPKSNKKMNKHTSGQTLKTMDTLTQAINDIS